MSRTIRRKHYRPAWVTQTDCLDPESGRRIFGSVRELEGAERAAQIRWWHEDKHSFWGARPPKPFRQLNEQAHRAAARDELIRWAKDPDFEPLIRRKPRLGWWD